MVDSKVELMVLMLADERVDVKVVETVDLVVVLLVDY